MKCKERLGRKFSFADVSKFLLKHWSLRPRRADTKKEDVLALLVSIQAAYVILALQWTDSVFLLQRTSELVPRGDVTSEW